MSLVENQPWAAKAPRGFFSPLTYVGEIMNNRKKRIRFAIQKSGRLSDATRKMLADWGVCDTIEKNILLYKSQNFPIDILMVRDDDIPALISDGICDFGVVGNNVLQECNLQKISEGKALNTEIVTTLGFANCRLSIALPKATPFLNIYSLNKCTLATTYPYILSEFIQKQSLEIDIARLSGSVEIAPKLGMADGIFDVVSTGATLEANNLREVVTVFESEAVLIKSSLKLPKYKQEIADRMMETVFSSASLRARRARQSSF